MRTAKWWATERAGENCPHVVSHVADKRPVPPRSWCVRCREEDFAEAQAEAQLEEREDAATGIEGGHCTRPGCVAAEEIVKAAAQFVGIAYDPDMDQADYSRTRKDLRDALRVAGRIE